MSGSDLLAAICRRTKEGFEMNFGVNYIAHVHLTQLLLEVMINQVPACSLYFHNRTFYIPVLAKMPFMRQQAHEQACYSPHRCLQPDPQIAQIGLSACVLEQCTTHNICNAGCADAAIAHHRDDMQIGLRGCTAQHGRPEFSEQNVRTTYIAMFIWHATISLILQATMML